MVSAALCLALILCHTAWGVVTFHGYDERKYHYVAFVWAAHYLFSCLVSWELLFRRLTNNYIWVDLIAASVAVSLQRPFLGHLHSVLRMINFTLEGGREGFRS